MIDWSVTVLGRGEKPEREYVAYLNIGVQGFEVSPLYFEGEDEQPRESAAWMADMVRKAINTLIESAKT